MKITFKGSPMTLQGKALAVNDKLQDFKITKNDLSIIEKKDTKGVRIFLSVPSVDTSVCSMEVAKFMNLIKDLPITCYSVSMDLPFALDRWCQANNNENVITTSDYRDHSFAKASKTYMEELGLLARAVFVVDANDTITYVEYVSEVANEPNYDAVIEAVHKLL